jgi:hypothetical protein
VNIGQEKRHSCKTDISDRCLVARWGPDGPGFRGEPISRIGTVLEFRPMRAAFLTKTSDSWRSI